MMPGSPGPSLTRSPLRQIRIFGTPAARASFGVLEQMQGLAMHGDQKLRTDPGDHVAQLVAARMAGDVDEMGAVGDDLDALRHQAVDDGAHRLFVAGNGARGKDHAVALFSVTCG